MHRYIVGALESHGVVSLLIILVVFSLGVSRNIQLPGLYFDAVNPDYLAAKILADNKFISHFPPWDAFPILGNYYHGVMHTYFGLFFFKIFGFSVFSLRIAHALFGFGILVLSNMVLTRLTGSRVFSLLVIGVLALDPAFIFAFRTQTYITLSPLLFLLSSFYLLLLIRDKFDTPGHGDRFIAYLVMSGALSGWAFYGYFIYIFFVPALIVIIAHLSRTSGRSAVKMILYWLAGFTLGALLYFIGYGRLWLELGGVSEILKNASGLNITGRPIGFFDRPHLLFQHAVSSIAGNFQYSVIFNHAAPMGHGVVKFAVMAAIILPALLIMVVRKRATAELGYLLLLITSFFMVSLYFAGHIGPHHMIPMLPFLYIALGASIHQAGSKMFNGATKPVRIIVSASLISMVLFFGILNAQHQNAFQKQLVETGGVKYYSDALTHLAEEAKHKPNPPYYVFGEWGFLASFSFLTAGRVPYTPAMDDSTIARVPCSSDLAVLFWGQANPEVESFASRQGRVTTRKAYYQRDGAVAFTALGVTDRKNCSSSETRPGY